MKVIQLISPTSTHTGTAASENQELVNELHKPNTRKLKKGKVYSSYWDNILAAGLADM